MRTCGLLIVMACFALSCADSLLPSEIVRGPRILAVIADPPEANPGAAFDLRVVGVDPTRTSGQFHFEWFACLDPSDSLAALGVRVPEWLRQGCIKTLPLPTGEMLRVIEENGDRARVPSSVSALLTSDAALDQLAAGSGLPRTTIDRILATSGIPLAVEVWMIEGTDTGDTWGEAVVLQRARKRIALRRTSGDDHASHNPSVPSLIVHRAPAGAEFTFGATAEQPTECLGPTLAVSASDLLVFLPGTNTPHEAFQVWDFDGHVRTVTEELYFNWYATAGGFSADVTRHREGTLDAQVSFRAPASAQHVDLWMVVRDGHLGTSACHFGLEIRE